MVYNWPQARSSHKLKEFEQETDSLAALIYYGLKGNIEWSPFTWKSIVEALCSCRNSQRNSDLVTLAKRLKLKYCLEEGKEDSGMFIFYLQSNTVV